MTFEPNAPVFLQIADTIKKKILFGEYPPNGQIPSVRALAAETGTTPNTVQRALTLLEREGLISTRGTVGKFVTDNNAMIADLKTSAIRIEITSFLQKIKEYGFTAEDVIPMLTDKEERDG